ncbi:MAG: diphosphate--fructose-6-phosphate 1-phosphotransferase [Planctomycetes bacterium B3_Pla]|nr:MAG: diphosphate--fructose-6-phosphate 1-phosphotransferase [Planctomycetes bacterium B3_Pla]
MDAYCLKPDELPDLAIETLGAPTIDSPLVKGKRHFVDDDEKILVYSHSDNTRASGDSHRQPPTFERAGPRRKIFFEMKKLNCGIVTCGGLCPGLNDVIRTITLSLLWSYGVRKVFGFRYGYAGLSSSAPQPPLTLTPELVNDIHLKGGDILSSSRGPQDADDMIDNLQKLDIGILFVIGGDGTLRGARALAEAAKKRQAGISIIGVPKTIDNDISGTEQSFGFSTAVEAARLALCGAHEEARGAWNGIGLVKLMGRDSGFIAAYATLANSDVNFCFIPEAPLVLEGENGFLQALEKRLDEKHHALIVVAEGAGQNLIEKNDDKKKDISGNILHEDIGLFLKKKITEHFQKKNKPHSLKYIDPSYMIRSLPADSNDSAFCVLLGQNAVHAGLSGRTNMVVGYWNQHFVHVPIALTVLKRKKVDPEGHLWQTVLETTGQG